MSDGQFPATLVLPFTSIHSSSSGCPNDFAAQIYQGNTFSAAFDMTQAPHAPGENGDVTLKTDPESNFQASSRWCSTTRDCPARYPSSPTAGPRR